MTSNENDIMRDVYYYLRDHNDPPAQCENGCEAFWRQAALDAQTLAHRKWNDHPLALELLAGVYRYLEGKCRNRDGDGA